MKSPYVRYAPQVVAAAQARFTAMTMMPIMAEVTMEAAAERYMPDPLFSLDEIHAYEGA